MPGSDVAAMILVSSRRFSAFGRSPSAMGQRATGGTHEKIGSRIAPMGTARQSATFHLGLRRPRAACATQASASKTVHLASNDAASGAPVASLCEPKVSKSAFIIHLGLLPESFC